MKCILVSIVYSTKILSKPKHFLESGMLGIRGLLIMRFNNVPKRMKTFYKVVALQGIIICMS